MGAPLLRSVHAALHAMLPHTRQVE